MCGRSQPVGGGRTFILHWFLHPNSDLPPVTEIAHLLPHTVHAVYNIFVKAAYMKNLPNQRSSHLDINILYVIMKDSRRHNIMFSTSNNIMLLIASRINSV